MSPHKFPTSSSSRSLSYKEMGELSPRRAARVLVVDDNPDTRMLMRELLGTRGYEVVAVPDAAQAEREIQRELPDLILSDVIMPGKSGYELCREVKDNPATRLIPFVLITGLSDREDKLRGIEAGADDFLSLFFRRNCLPASSRCSSSKSSPTNWKRPSRCCAAWA